MRKKQSSIFLLLCIIMILLVMRNLISEKVFASDAYDFKILDSKNELVSVEYELGEENKKEPIILFLINDDGPEISSFSFECEDEKGYTEIIKSNMGMLSLQVENDKTYTLRLLENNKYTMKEVIFTYKYMEDNYQPISEENKELLTLIKLDNKDGKENSYEEEEINENNNFIKIVVKQDGKPVKNYPIQLSMKDMIGSIPILNIINTRNTNDKGEIIFDEFPGNKQLFLKTKGKGITFDKETIEFETDKNGIVKTINGKTITGINDLTVTFEGQTPNENNTFKLNVLFKTIDMDTGEPLEGVELTANTIDNRLSGYETLKSDNKGNINFQLEASEEGKAYSVSISKNAQFLWDFEPNEITIIVTKNGEINIVNSKELLFKVRKNDRTSLLQEIKSEIVKARKLLNENQFEDTEEVKKLIDSIKDFIDGAEMELKKSSTIPYYIQTSLDNLRNAENKLKEFIINNNNNNNNNNNVVKDEPTASIKKLIQVINPKTNVYREAFVSGYPDGSFRPYEYVSRSEAIVMFAKGLSNEKVFGKGDTTTFLDANGEWYSGALNYMASKGLISGYPDGTFRPNLEITRAEFIQMISNYILEEINKETKNVFRDSTNHWAKDAIDIAYRNQIILGYPDGTFKPDQKITRSEAITIINNLLGRVTKKESLANIDTNSLNKFNDIDPSQWFYYQVIDAANSHDFYKENDKDYNVWTNKR